MKKSVIVIGGGHNGLICATYLAKAGHPVTVLESRSIVGGCAVTEEIYPGFKFSRAAYVQSLLRPQIIKDLELHRWGLRFIPRPVASFTPMVDGRSLSLGHDMQMNIQEIGRFSKRDAQKYPEFEKFLARIANAMEPLLDSPPPDMKIRSFADLRPWFLGLRAAMKLGSSAPQAARLLLAPARELLDEWFDSEPLKGTLGTDAVIGAFASPSSPGTGYVLFHHVMGGIWSYVKGGMGALSDALARSAKASGVDVITNARVEYVHHTSTYFTVATQDKRYDRRYTAHAVVSSIDPQATFNLMEDTALPEDYRRALATIDYRSPSVKYNFALDRLPQFNTHEKAIPTGTIHLGAQTLDELDTAYAEAVAGRASTNPMIEMTIPSVLDNTLAPEGKHVASAFVQYAPILDKDDLGWSQVYQDMTAGVLRAVEAVAPGFTDSILHMEVLAAPDLERIFGITGGNIFHGAMTPDRLALFRPFPGWANYTTPIPNFFLCGSGTHPGGGVMGAPGRNAARIISRKL